MGYADGIAECGDLVADALKGVAEIASVDDKAPSDGGALGGVAIKTNIHDYFNLTTTITTKINNISARQHRERQELLIIIEISCKKGCVA